MVTPIALLRQPSALDLADALVHPGGAREYVFRPPEDVERQAAEREGLALARAAYDAAQARETEVARLRNEIISEGDTGGLVDAWLIDARAKAEAAHARRDETADDDARHRAAEMEVAQIEGEIRAAFDAWIRFDSTLPRPDPRLTELDAQHAIIAATRDGARVAGEAQYQADVADALVEALEDMQPIRTAQAWLAANAPVIEQSIQATVESLRVQYGRLAAMEEAAEPSFDQRMRMRALGVFVRDRRLRDRTTVDLPPLLTDDRATGFRVEADPCQVTAHRIGLAQLGDDALPPPSRNQRQRLYTAPVCAYVARRARDPRH